MIQVYKPSLKGNEKKYLSHCVESGWISSVGEYVRKFEEQFGMYVGNPHCTTASNGTVALHLALLAVGIESGDEVIVPSFTYVASVNAILQVGAKPVFVDSDPVTMQIDIADIRRKITQNTKAIMAVHLYGIACDMAELQEICSQYSVLLIEDCAEALGTLVNGTHVGNFGDVSTYSFFGNKTITCGEGGMVVARSPEIIERVARLKNQGVSQTRRYWHDFQGYNYRLTNIQAAIGLAQLERIDEIIVAKRAIQAFYLRELSSLPLLVLSEPLGQRSSFWMCSILVDDPDVREPLRAHLEQNGIETRPFFPLVSEFSYIDCNEGFSNAHFISGRGINLPSYPDLTEAELRLICDKIREFYDE